MNIVQWRRFYYNSKLFVIRMMRKGISIQMQKIMLDMYIKKLFKEQNIKMRLTEDHIEELINQFNLRVN